MRYVIDANVILSALLFRQSKPAKAFQKAMDEGEILCSETSIKELRTTLLKNKFDRYLTVEERVYFLNIFLKQIRTIKTNETISACRDPKDNMILELAVDGNADFIITGDQDLLVLNPFRKIKILNPVNFLEIIKTE
jgi:uncharacterized protein